MNVGSRRRALDRPPGAYERDALGSEILHKRSALRAIRVNGHVQRVAVIEPHTIMQRRLPVCADRERPPEAGLEEPLEPSRALS